MQGRRRPDQKRGDLPDDLRGGDYWKLVDDSGQPLRSKASTNLTGACWMVAAPLAGTYLLGDLMLHTVREHDDGTISVRPNEGSSNSILIQRNAGKTYHGYIEHGVWRSC